MLDETVTLTYSNDGVVAATDHVFKKRAHETDSAAYRNITVINDPSLPDHSFRLAITEPKATKDYYGTRRSSVNLRHEHLISVPTGGEAKLPVVAKIDLSIPVGVQGGSIEGFIGCFRSFVNHDIFKRLVKSLET